MANYNIVYNRDDSVIRHIIIGLLADLNNKVYFYRQMDENNRVAVDIPFYYSITGDDQFLRDNFLFTTPSGPDCVPVKAFSDANYDSIPRGILNLESLSIDTARLVNRRIRGAYSRLNDQGEMEGYTAEFEMIPIDIGFELVIMLSSMLDTFKVTEALIKLLYKNNYFNVEVGHLQEATHRLTSYYAMPDEYNIEKPIDFTFDDKGTYKITVNINVNSFIPSFEWETEMHAGNRMYEINSTIVPRNEEDFMSAVRTTKADVDTQIIDENS